MAATKRGTSSRSRGSASGRASVAPGGPVLHLTATQKRELAGLCAIAVGAIWVLLLGFPAAPGAHSFSDLVTAGVGVGGWIIGMALIAGGVGMLALRASERSAGQTLVALFVTTLAATSMAAVIDHASGGLVGREIGLRLAALIGAPAALVALGAVALAGLVVGLELSPSRVSAAGYAAGRVALGRLFAPRPGGTLARINRASAPIPPAAHPRIVEPLGVQEAEPSTPPEEPSPEVFQRIFEGLDEGTDPDPPIPARTPEPEAQLLGKVAGADQVDQIDEPDGEEPEPSWVLPGLEMLDSIRGKRERLRDEIRTRIKTIETTLENFGVESKVTGCNAGPTVTQYELQPGPGVPVRRVLAYQTDLALALAAPIRIQAPIPGKSAIGIEVPNKAAQLVTLKEVVQSPSFTGFKSHLAVALGADVSGRPVIGDLAAMPHLLIAGATGSGKSVCINAVLAGLLMQSSPGDMRLILVDPKRVELSNFSGLPHLLVPVVVEPDGAVASLRWAVVEMEQRYKLFAGHGARNISVFNERAPQLGLRPLPKIVIVIDELADLMMVAASEIEDLICRIAQLARAVGIHLIVATQRPSADIITGLIKANIPSRVAFAVSSGVDSRVILDEMGAEKLLGRGDMLYLPIDAGKAVRLQGAFVSDRELDQLIGYWKSQGQPRYQEEILQAAALAPERRDGTARRDPLFERAGRIVIGEGRGAASLLQRKLNVGYTRAARLIDQLAEARVVGPYEGSKSREVLMNMADFEQLLDGGGDEEE